MKIIDKYREIFGSGRDKGRLEREIQSIINEGEETGLIDQDSGEMIQSILEFRETVVREVMVPRTEMVALPIDAGIGEIIATVERHNHTRMPVYRESLDNIIGILNVKDLLRYWSKPVAEADIIQNLRKPYFIPETKNVHQLLPEFKVRKSHMAIVIDEYGGTSGLVTLEDLLEEIRDEHDADEKGLIDLPDGHVMADARTEIEKVEEHFNIKFPEGKFETLGGLVLHLIKRIPVAGEIVSCGDLEMTIESADERSIKKIRIRKTNGPGS